MPQETCIIYLRKSTDREDRQQISLETQRQYCEALVREHGYHSIILEDRKSAKDENKRPAFKQLLSICKKGGIDYVISYDPTRISRNTVDAALFTELINKKHIKGFYAAESRQFFGGMDIFSAMMLGISFLMSKADNQLRSSNTKRKMETYYQAGRVMTRMPFGYSKHHYFDATGRLIKDVKVVEEEARLVKDAFRMRLAGAQLKEIAEHFTNAGYPRTAGTIDKLLHHRFYCGIQSGKLGEGVVRMPGYTPLVNAETFDTVNQIRRPINHIDRPFFNPIFHGMVFGTDNISFVPFQGRSQYNRFYNYYKSQHRSELTVNISESKLLDMFDEYMVRYNFPMEGMEAFGRLLEKELRKNGATTYERQKVIASIEKMREEKKTLIRKLASGILTDDEYREMSEFYQLEIRKSEERLGKIDGENRDIGAFVRNWVKLFGSLYGCYKTAKPPQKVDVLKAIQVKLFVGVLKAFTVQVSPVLEALKELNFVFGSVTENRTPITGMRILCPNR